MQRLVRAGVLLVAQPVIERAGGEEGRGSATHWQRHTIDHLRPRPRCINSAISSMSFTWYAQPADRRAYDFVYQSPQTLVAES